jgi:hypothetical protein
VGLLPSERAEGADSTASHPVEAKHRFCTHAGGTRAFACSCRSCASFTLLMPRERAEPVACSASMAAHTCQSASLSEVPRPSFKPYFNNVPNRSFVNSLIHQFNVRMFYLLTLPNCLTSFETLRDPIRERLLSMLGHSFCSLSDMISDERSSQLTTKIELVEVRELTESTDWFLPFHLFTPASPRRSAHRRGRTVRAAAARPRSPYCTRAELRVRHTHTPLRLCWERGGAPQMQQRRRE